MIIIKTIMTKSARKIVFLIFLGGFLISAPMVILYTAGYRFNFSHLSLVKTGLLSITTEPRGAEIFIDGKTTKKTTPEILKNIIPDNHVIHLEKTGYLPWEKTLEIKERETTFVPHAVLFENSTAQIQEVGNFASVSFSPAGLSAAMVNKEEGWWEIWQKNFITQEKKLLLRLPVSEAEHLKVSWTPNGQYILVEEKAKKSQWEVVGADGLKRLVFADLLKTNGWSEKDAVATVESDPFLDNIFYLQTTAATWLVDLNKNSSDKILSFPAPVWQRGELLLFLKTNNGTTELTRQEKDGTQQVVAYLPNGEYNFWPAPPTLVLLKNKNREQIFLVDDRGVDKPIYLQTEAFTATWNPNNEKQLLYVSNFELHVYDTEKQADELITRLSTPISATAWHPSGSDIFYTNGKNLTAIELDKRGDGRNTFDLVDLDSLKTFVVTNDSQNIFLWGKEGIETGIFRRSLNSK